MFNTGSGGDTVVDFVDGADKVEIGNGAESFADVLVADSGANALISFANVTITLLNVDHLRIGGSGLHLRLNLRTAENR